MSLKYVAKVLISFITLILSENIMILAQPTTAIPPSPNLSIFPVPSQNVSLPKIATQPFCFQEVTYPDCPTVATFDFIDLRFFVGTWYEIGTTGQNKLKREAGSICQQVNYTLTSTIKVEKSTQIEVVNIALQVVGPVAAYGIEAIGGATRRVCNAAKKICSSLSSTSQITQISAQVGSLGASISLTHPSESLILMNVTTKISTKTKQLQSIIDSLARNISLLQQIVSSVSNNDGSRDASIDQLKSTLSSARATIANGTVLLSELDNARSDILQVATSLLVPKASTIVPAVPPFETIGQLWKAAIGLNEQEQFILTKIAKIQVNFATIEGSSELLKVDQSNQSKIVREVGSATQNITSLGKFDLQSPSKFNASKNSPFWILALDGVPSQGYQAALTYSCIENTNGDVKKALSIISRTTTLDQSTITKYLVAATAFGFDFECDDPFILTNQDPTCVTIFNQQSK